MVEINNRREVNKYIYSNHFCTIVAQFAADKRSLGTSCVIIECVEVMVATWTRSFVLYGLTAIPSLSVIWTALYKTKENSEPYWENYLKFLLWLWLLNWDFFLVCDNVLKCIFVICLCGRYLLITMLNLYN